MLQVVPEDLNALVHDLSLCTVEAIAFADACQERAERDGWPGIPRPDEVHDLRTVMLGRADQGLLAITGSLTPDARREARREGLAPRVRSENMTSPVHPVWVARPPIE